ncbi:hypothetical protein DVS28_b0602 (plasmid) [Euzebya pacifica]|uniref:Uncharacterized protein n=1 Tax=Euzebya pacifica TaxID=1608957 RepID=A0A346Y795_9ACTN|nr:hypothetical protein [Euzebya pacifica]AXV10342.1 hypothetical protein DVS28_b0602 [Euzebya pacifica]
MDPTQFVVPITLAAVAFVWVPRVWAFARWRQMARTAVTYRLVPGGSRPVDLDEVTNGVSGQLATVDTHQWRQFYRGGIVVHRFRDDSAVATALVVYGSREPDTVADGIASAVGATAHREPDLALPDAGQVWHTVRQSYLGRNNAHKGAGLPPVERAADEIVRMMSAHPDANICLSIACEPTRNWEDDRLRDWYQTRSGIWDDTESVGQGQAARVAIAATTDDPTLAKTLTSGVPDQLHRWPFQDRGLMVASTRGWLATGLALAAGPIVVLLWRAITWAAAALGFLGGTIFDGAATGEAIGHLIGGGTTLALIAAAAVMVVAGAIAWNTSAGFNTAQREWKMHLAAGLLPVERAWRYSPMRYYRYRRHLAARARAGQDDNAARPGVQIAGPYPYRPHTLVLSSEQIGQLIAFPSVSSTGTDRTEAVAITAPGDVIEATRDAGRGAASLLGHDPKGNPVAIFDEDRKYGLFMVGDPGAGKTNSLLQVWAEDARARQSKDRRDGRMAMLWIETKGGGADDAERLLRHVGYEPNRHPAGYVRIDAVSNTGPRLELLDRTDPEGAAARLVAAMRYAFDEGSIGARSEAALNAAFTLALQVTDTCAGAVGLGDQVPNAVRIATILMERSDNNELKGRLLKAFLHEATLQRMRLTGWEGPPTDHTGTFTEDFRGRFKTEEPTGGSTGSPMYDAAQAWAYYELGVPSREWSSIFEAPRNKLVALARLSGVWDPDPSRKVVTLNDLLDYHCAAILNFGAVGSKGVDSETSERMGAILTYMLWETVKTRCAGWLDHGRSVGLYADELSHLSGTGSGDDVIAQMHDKGRAFGMQLTFATQRFEQLPQRTGDAVLGFGTRAYLRLENAELAKKASIDLCGGPEGAFSARDIREQDKGRAAIRLRLHGNGQAPFTVVFPYVMDGVRDLEAYTRELPAGTVVR